MDFVHINDSSFGEGDGSHNLVFRGKSEEGQKNFPSKVMGSSRCEISTVRDGGIYIGEPLHAERYSHGSFFSHNGVSFCGSFSSGELQNGYEFSGDQCKVYLDGKSTNEVNLSSLSDETLVEVAARISIDLALIIGDNNDELTTDVLISSPLDVVSQSSKNDDFHSASDRLEVRSTISVMDMDSPRELIEPIDDLRDEVAHTASPEAVFACACPVGTEFFSVSRFMRRLFVFVFPFFALPGFCCSPCAIDSTDTEREFIVSGASLQRSFNTPTASLYVVAFAILCELGGVTVFFMGKNTYGSLCTGNISFNELVSPCFPFFLFALTGASYFGYRRTPHGLEHMNRGLTAELTSLAADVVDSKSKICIYTWDETGRDKEKNKRYRLKWMSISFFACCFIAGAGSMVRWGLGFQGVGNTTTISVFTLLSSVSSGCLTFLITYYAMKNLDLEREVCSKLRVLSRIAYIERKSLLTPFTFDSVHFNCDSKLDISDLKNGFSGWYTMRSLVLCASPLANHQSRGAVMSLFILSSFLYSISACFYGFYWYLAVPRCEYSYFLAHSTAAILFWGIISVQYMNTCLSVKSELKKHLYIMDVCSLYHRLQNKDIKASDIIQDCRKMAHTHDIAPSLLNIPLHPIITGIMTFWIILGIFLSLYMLAFNLLNW